MENTQVASVFDEIADLLELKEGNAFRIRAYRNAAQSVRGLSGRLEDLVKEGKDLTKLHDVGESTADKIREILETGTCERVQQLRDDVPAELTELMKIPGVGARTAKSLHDELGVTNLDDVKKACKEGRISKLEGFGKKTQENIRKGIETVKKAAGRMELRTADESVEALKRHLDGIKELKTWTVAGSYRRRKETIGDLDMLLQAPDRKRTGDELKKFEDVDEVVSSGSERITVRLKSGLQIDFRFFEPESFGAAEMYFTGSRAHNVALRKRAKERDWKLNEYGLFKDDHRLAGKTEASIYKRLNLQFIPPEMRENRGEIDVAAEGNLPSLVKQSDIHGDLHCHTTATDGADSIAAMADAAEERGYEYLVITDHSKAVRVANGLNNDQVRKHADAIRKEAQKRNTLWLIAGIEVDILKSGKLDLDEEVLAGLDWVIASIHSHFDQTEKQTTDRLLKAIESGVVHAMGHPCGRLLGKRDLLRFNAHKVFEACRKNNVCLEINAQPHRMDLPDTYCKDAAEVGVTICLGSDAHKTDNLSVPPLAVDVARRGWLERSDVLNTKTKKQLREYLKKV